MTRSGILIRTFSIYAIGTIGVKIIAFLLVPLYTHYLSREEMGYFDIAISAILFIVPLITCDLRDGVFRFLMDPEYKLKHHEINNFVLKLLIRNCLFVVFFTIILAPTIKINYWGVIIFTLIVYSLYEVIIQVVRGLGQTKLFVFLGILNTFIICILSIFFLIYLKWGVLSVFYANIISRIISLIIVEYKLKLFRTYLKTHRKTDKHINKKILYYSLPLLPNVISWWLIDSSNKFFIENYLGLDQNGIFSVAVKFSNILQAFVGIYYQTWQEIALKEMNSNDRDSFFSKMFNSYVYILSIGSIVFSLFLKLTYPYIIGANFTESLIYVLPLFISVIFYALSSFLDLAYQCSRKTSRGLPSIISTAILSVILNYILIQKFELWGIVFSSIISYFYLLIYRLIDSRFAFKIHLKKDTLYSTIILLAGAILFYNTENKIILITTIIVLISASIFYLRKTYIK